MPWIRLDDDFLDHPKWVRAIRDGGSAAVHLWMGLCTWCSRHLTDGEVPPDMLDSINGPRGAKLTARAYRALADASLIARRGDGGVTLIDYHERNPTRAEVLAARRRRSESQRKRRLRTNEGGRHSTSEADVKPTCNEVPARPGPAPIFTTTTERAPETTVSDPATATATVIKEIPVGYVLDAELRSEAIAAGVPPHTIDERFNDLKRGPIGGSRGIFARELRSYIRRQFPKWRTWNETDAAKSSRRRDVPNQPNAGVTGLEKAKIVR